MKIRGGLPGTKDSTVAKSFHTWTLLANKGWFGYLQDISALFVLFGA